jgi:hypothetical protein
MEMLTEEEEKAIKSLDRVAKKWPKSLKLFSQSRTLLVIKHHPGHPEDDHGRIVDIIPGIYNDGGDNDWKEWADD